MPPPTPEPKGKVFLVDDHPLVREWLTNLIVQQPDLSVCGEADSVTAAIDGIARSNPDVAVVDLSLSGPSGFELLKHLKTTHPALAVLVLSMHEEAHFAERALRAGAKGYIMKREATRKIIEGIRRLVAGGVYLSEAVSQRVAANVVHAKASAGGLPLDRLSDRELAVFELLGQGREANDIAARLQINAKTVHTYFARIREKLNLNSSTELLREAFHWHEEQGGERGCGARRQETRQP